MKALLKFAIPCDGKVYELQVATSREFDNLKDLEVEIRNIRSHVEVEFDRNNPSGWIHEHVKPIAGVASFGFDKGITSADGILTDGHGFKPILCGDLHQKVKCVEIVIIHDAKIKKEVWTRKFLNTILILAAVAALVFCVVAKGLQWFIGFVVLYACVLGLLKLNTDFIENYSSTAKSHEHASA